MSQENTPPQIPDAERQWLNRAQNLGLISDHVVRFSEIPKDDRRRAYQRLGKPNLT